jgi:hypothetical protein
MQTIAGTIILPSLEEQCTNTEGMLKELAKNQIKIQTKEKGTANRNFKK